VHGVHLDDAAVERLKSAGASEAVIKALQESAKPKKPAPGVTS